MLPQSTVALIVSRTYSKVAYQPEIVEIQNCQSLRSFSNQPQHLNAIDHEKILQRWLICTQFEVKLQSVNKPSKSTAFTIMASTLSIILDKQWMARNGGIDEVGLTVKNCQCQNQQQGSQHCTTVKKWIVCDLRIVYTCVCICAVF